MADPGFPVGGRRPRRGRQLPRQLHFEKFVCQNERIWTLRGGAHQWHPLDPPMQSQVGWCKRHAPYLNCPSFTCSDRSRISVGGRQPHRGVPTPKVATFQKFVCQNERIWTLTRRMPAVPPLDPPLTWNPAHKEDQLTWANPAIFPNSTTLRLNQSCSLTTHYLG